MVILREWQRQAREKAINWLVHQRLDKRFLIEAAPGSGKTIAACEIALQLFELEEIDRVIVIAPRGEVVSQWSDDFHRITGRYMLKVTSSDDAHTLNIDVSATWAAVQDLADQFHHICNASRTLVITDEHHHAAMVAAWGQSADSAFSHAKYVLVLTGTPVRSDGQASIWIDQDASGRIKHPEDGTYRLSYGEAVDLGYCRPVTFHRHEAMFSINLDDETPVTVSSKEPAKISDGLRLPALQRVLDFRRLVCIPQYEDDGATPLRTGYQATMIDWASKKLTELQLRMPEAGGLVIAPNIEMAEYFVDVIQQVEGERPYIVHNKMQNADGRIKAFRQSSARWIVSVAMISEGVDIKRLRILVYLPNAMTELAFRQAVGRVVRSNGPNDDTRAYVVMPSLDILEGYARQIEDEMSPAQRVEPEKPTTKKCPACSAELALDCKVCTECGHEFPSKAKRSKVCPGCGAENSASAKECDGCGQSFIHSFTMTLKEAMRDGAIVRGIDLEEDEVQEGEAIANDVREKVLRSGDELLVRALRKLPEESYGRLKKIMG